VWCEVSVEWYLGGGVGRTHVPARSCEVATAHTRAPLDRYSRHFTRHPPGCRCRACGRSSDQPDDDLCQTFLRRHHVAEVFAHDRRFKLGHSFDTCSSHAILRRTNNKTRPAWSADRVLQSARRRLVHGIVILRPPNPPHQGKPSAPQSVETSKLDVPCSQGLADEPNHMRWFINLASLSVVAPTTCVRNRRRTVSGSMLHYSHRGPKSVGVVSERDRCRVSRRAKPPCLTSRGPTGKWKLRLFVGHESCRMFVVIPIPDVA
jgi:hypothetical protein